MKYTFDGQEFEIILGYDVINDGIYLEAWNANDKVVLFAFFSDETHRFTFSMFGDELPFELKRVSDEVVLFEARAQRPP